MLVERGVVTSVDAQSITVNCRSKIDCVRCAQGKGCGGGILARWLGNRQYSVQAFYNPAVQTPNVGDFVAIAIPAKRIVRLAAIMYILPLLLMLLVLIIQNTFFTQLSELLVIVAAVISLLLGFKLSARLVVKANRQGLMLPSLLTQKNHIQIPVSNCENRIKTS